MFRSVKLKRNLVRFGKVTVLLVIKGQLPVATRATTFSLVVYEPEETQQILTTLGFYSGPIDGIPGPRTAAALREAQKSYGLARLLVKASAETLAKLREELARTSRQCYAMVVEPLALNRYDVCLRYEEPHYCRRDRDSQPLPHHCPLPSGWGRRRRGSSSLRLLPNQKALINYAGLL